MRARTALLTGAVALGILTGCSAEPADDAPDTEPAPTVSVEPTPTTPPPVHAAVVTTPEEQDAAEAAGMAVYEKPDGTLIALDPAQPLPPELYADLFARLAEQLADPWSQNGSSDTGWLDAPLRELAQDTGRHILLLHAEWGHPASLGYDGSNPPDIDDPPYPCWRISGDTNLVPDALHAVHHEQAVKLAEVQAWVDAQPASDHWELIVAPGPTVPRPEWGHPPPPGF